MLGRFQKNTIMPSHLIYRTSQACTGIVVILALLNGCAAQKMFDQATTLVQQDKTEEGLQKMQEASKLDPGQIEFKARYYETRDASIAGYLEKGNSYIVAARYQEAADLFNRVLGMDSGNIRARDGLARIQAGMRHDQLLADADQLFQAGDVRTANQKLAVVLTEDPSNVRALQLQARIAEKTVKQPAGMALQDKYKKQITLQFKDASLRQIFDIIAQTSGLNFIFDKDVKTDQKTSIFLKDSTVESAVFYTLMTNQLDQQVMDGNTILIYPNSASKQKDYQQLVVKSFFLTNADAKTVAATLKAIVKTRDVVVDEKLNMIIMRDTPDAIKLAEKLVALHDIAEPEVMLDVAVLEVKRTKLQDLGVLWPSGVTLTPLTPLQAASVSGATSAQAALGLGVATSGQTSGPLVLSNLKNMPASNVSIGNPSATVNAHSTDGDANLLANPRIRTRNHEKAKIMIGDRVPNITVNTSPTATQYISETITYVDVGLKLEVEPNIYLDDEVGIKISLEVSNIVSQLITKSGSAAYQIGTRNASSVLRLKDGETQILAGLLDDEERHTINKIPALGDIPILGHLFGSTNTDIEKTEIVLSITPHLIRNIRRPDANSAAFESGTENNLKPRPEGIGTVSLATAGSTESGPIVLSGPVPVRKNILAQGSRGENGTPVSAAVPADGAAGMTPAALPDAPAENTAAHSVNLSMLMKGQTTPRVGDVFNMEIIGQSDTMVANFPLIVGFNPMYFEVVKVDEGNFLKQRNAKSGFSSEIDPKGQVLINGTSTGGSGGVAAGTLAAITFRVLPGATDADIQVLSATPADADGHPMAVNNGANMTVHVYDGAAH